MTTRSRGIFLLILGGIAFIGGALIATTTETTMWRVAGISLLILSPIPAAYGALLLRKTDR